MIAFASQTRACHGKAALSIVCITNSLHHDFMYHGWACPYTLDAAVGIASSGRPQLMQLWASLSKLISRQIIYYIWSTDVCLTMQYCSIMWDPPPPSFPTDNKQLVHARCASLEHFLNFGSDTFHTSETGFQTKHTSKPIHGNSVVKCR